MLALWFFISLARCLEVLPLVTGGRGGGATTTVRNRSQVISILFRLPHTIHFAASRAAVTGSLRTPESVYGFLGSPRAHFLDLLLRHRLHVLGRTNHCSALPPVQRTDGFTGYQGDS